MRNKKPRILVYDDGGKALDRYTVVIGKDVFAMSANPNSPQGVNQYVFSLDDIDNPNSSRGWGKKLPWKKVPSEVKKAIRRRLEEI